MDLVIGDKILVEYSTFGDRFLSIVANVKADGRLLVYSPITANIVKRLRTDRGAQVKYAYGGRLVGFSTRVLNTVEDHNGLIELAKPSGFYDAEDRHEPRCSCSFPAMIVEGDKAAQAVVEDMSFGYSRIRFLDGGAVPFLEDIEREVLLTFHPFDIEDKGYSVECIVKSAFIKDGARYAVLKFKKSEKKARKRISNFIEAQICCGIKDR